MRCIPVGDANGRCTCLRLVGAGTLAMADTDHGTPCRTGGYLIGGHRYTVHVTTGGTFSCERNCGAIMGRYNSKAPDGVDPFGDCPGDPAARVAMAARMERA